MKTRICMFDHAAGLRDTIEVPLGRNATICRLRQVIGEPDADSYEIFSEDIEIYARVDVEPITMHIFSYSPGGAAGAWNEIVSALTRRALT